jgi:hypothetical protein
MAFASVPVGDYVVEKGEIATVKSSDFGHRGFCRDCGTPLYMRVDHQPETIDFSLATLDEPGSAAPGYHIFYASRIAWAEPADRDRLSIGFGGVWAACDGQPLADYDEAPVAAHLKGREVTIEVDLGLGEGRATVWTCDLTHGYISINADYRS